MSIITPIVGGEAIVSLGALGRGHHTARVRSRKGAFAGPAAEADVYLPEFVPPNATLHFDFEQWLGYREPAGLGRGGVISTPDAMLAVARLSPRTVQNAAGGIDLLGSSIIARNYSAAGLARGVPIEPLSINWLLRSGDLGHAVWSKGGVSVPAGPVAPDGVQAWGRITENSAGGQHYIGQYIGAVAVGDVLTTTVDVRATGIGAARHVFVTAYGEGYAVFNPASGAVVSAAGVTASVEPRGGGAYRVRCTVTKTNTNGTVFIGLWNPAGNNVYVGDGVSCVDAWGAQAEKRSTPTSYMPTVDTTAARYADDISTPFASWGTQGQGGLYVELVPNITGTDQTFARLDDGTSNNTIYIGMNGAGAIFGVVVAGGVSQAVLSLGTYAGGVLKAALAWAGNDFAARRNGGSLVTDASGSVPSGLTTLRIGSSIGVGYQSGHTQRVTVYPARLIMTNTKIGELVA